MTDSLQELNRELRLWEFFPDMGSYLPFWLPNGAVIRATIEEFWRREHLRQGYDLVYTPHIARRSVWEGSGHLERFGDRMFPPMVDEGAKEDYFLRPMNCPFHIKLYEAEVRSYRDLPLRLAELGTVYRYIPSGSFREMLEDRGFTQDDAHIFCERHKAKEEVAAALQLAQYFLRDVFRIDDYKVILRLRPRTALGEDALWEGAQTALREVLRELGLDYEEVPGEGVFYGPKIDFEIQEPNYGKGWICSTVQLDIILAEAAGLKYAGERGQEETPLIIHRTLLGSLERFIGILVSRTKGHVPAWLAPTQVLIIPIGGTEFGRNRSYGEEVKAYIQRAVRGQSLRIRVSERDEDLREAKKEAIKRCVPYIVVVGGRERLSEGVSVTRWTGESYPEKAEATTLAEFARELEGAVVVGG